MYSGQSAIDYLTAEISKVDSASSSHWNKYHSSFRFNGKNFEGIEGFGGFRRPRGTAFFCYGKVITVTF